MTVFKNYFKIVWGHKTPLLIYSIAFALIMAFSTQSNSEDHYRTVAVKIYLKDEAQTPLSKALSHYLSQNNRPIDMPESMIEDNLFYEVISAYLRLPKDFDQKRQVDFRSAPGDQYAFAIRQEVNQFLSQVAAYEKAGFAPQKAIDLTQTDLQTKVRVQLPVKDPLVIKDDSDFYFNFLNYVLMSQIILIVASLSSVYKKKEIRQRNLISPLPATHQSLQLILGHLTSGLCTWALYMILFALLWSKKLHHPHVPLLMLNAFIFTFCIVCLAVMIAQLVKNDNAVQGVMNVVALGSSFLCGAFVPQEFLGTTALTLARGLPSFYYIQNNNQLLTSPHLSTILPNLLILCAFSLAFISVSLLAARRRA